jgi:CTP:molybdopterin cytidylyltransferase MocA
MGREKILLPFGRSTVLETVLEALARTGVADRIAVLRPDLAEAASLAEAAGARVVVNPRPDEEMLASIRLGLAAISPDAEAVFIWPADHPAVAAATVALLAGRADPARVLLPTYRSRRGHPALVGRALLSAVEEIPPQQGLRSLWRTRADAIVEVAVEDPGVVANIDTPADYRRLMGRKDVP